MIARSRCLAERAARASKPAQSKGVVLVLMLAALGFAVMGASLPILNSRVVDTIRRSSRFEPAMTLVQIQAQVERLRAAAALFGLEPTPAHLRQLRIALAIVKSRIVEFREGQLGDFLSGDPERKARVAAIEHAMSDFDAAIGRPDAGEAARAVDQVATAVSKPLTDLNAEVISQATGLTAKDQDSMLASQRMQMTMLMGVVACGFGLIYLIRRQNADLMQAHAEQTRLTDEAMRIARYDSLTGLLNRNGFSPIVEAYCAKAHQTGKPFALLLLDLDKFKAINDTFSHAAGDAMLKSVASRLSDIRGEAGPLHLARLGGDEFAVLLEGDEAAAESVARQILECVRNPHQIGRLSIRSDTSIGVALAPIDGCEAADLMLASDIALYRAKAAGRGLIRRFKHSDARRNLGRANLEAALIDAVANKEFVPFYQPQVDLRTGRISAVEALMRWRREDAVISPANFLPLAEATGLIVDIERVMFDRLCQDLAAFPPEVKVSFNLSPARMFCTDVVESLLGPLARARLDARRLEVEITETMLLTNIERVSQIMSELQAAGLSVALDDFGSGYSSLGYLRRFPFDKLKIDKMFVDGLTERSQAFTILKTIVALGRTLDQTVIAEGIETAEQARLAQLAGCHLIQGYLISKPVPLDEALVLLRRNAGLPEALSA